MPKSLKQQSRPPPSKSKSNTNSKAPPQSSRHSRVDNGSNSDSMDSMDSDDSDSDSDSNAPNTRRKSSKEEDSDSSMLSTSSDEDDDDESSNKRKKSQSDDHDDWSDDEESPTLPQSFDDLPTDESSSESEDEDDVPIFQKVSNNIQKGKTKNLEPKKHWEKSGKERMIEKLAETKSGKFQDQPEVASSSNKKSKHKPTTQSSSRSTFFSTGAPSLSTGHAGLSTNTYSSAKSSDPRFSELSGKLNDFSWRQGYGFLEEIDAKEREELGKKIKTLNVPGRAGQKLRKKAGVSSEDGSELRQRLSDLKNAKGERERYKLKSSASAAVKHKIRDGVQTGEHGVYYLKRGEKKTEEIKARYGELKEKGEGAVKKAVEKRRKKVRGKELRGAGKDF